MSTANKAARLAQPITREAFRHAIMALRLGLGSEPILRRDILKVLQRIDGDEEPHFSDHGDDIEARLAAAATPAQAGAVRVSVENENDGRVFSADYAPTAKVYVDGLLVWPLDESRQALVDLNQKCKAETARAWIAEKRERVAKEAAEAKLAQAGEPVAWTLRKIGNDIGVTQKRPFPQPESELVIDAHGQGWACNVLRRILGQRDSVTLYAHPAPAPEAAATWRVERQDVGAYIRFDASTSVECGEGSIVVRQLLALLNGSDSATFKLVRVAEEKGNG